MAATIQHIELPKKPRARDTSSSIQEISQELITEGDFGGGGANWTAGTGWDDTGGFGAWNTSATTSASVYQSIDALVVGGTYKLIFTISNSSGGRQLVMLEGAVTNQRVTDDGSGNLGYGTYANGTHTIYFTALYANNEFNVYGHRDYSSFDIDDISLKQVESFSNNNHGKIYSGRALEFDGVSDHLTAPLGNLDASVSTSWAKGSIGSDNIVTNATGREVPLKLTSCVWVRLNAVGKSQFIQESGGGEWGIKVESSNKITVNYLTDNYGVDSSNDSASATGTKVLEANTWYRVVVNYNMQEGAAADVFQIYINGVLDPLSTSSELGSTGTRAHKRISPDHSLRIGSYGNGESSLLDGALSDYQVWFGNFTADDAAYDYANPESLALNASGSALTEGNLKIWYPMQDGHRGQQSYILDGANTGLGDEIADLTTGSSSESSYWSSATTSGVSYADSGQVSYYSLSSSVVSGVSYRVQATVSNYSGSGDLGFSTAGGVSSQARLSANGDISEVFVSDGDYPKLFGRAGNSATFSNISLKPINDKHHATTVFLGDEMWDLADNHTANWSTTGGATKAVIGGTTDGVKLTFGGTATNVNGSYIWLKDTSLTTDLTIGRTYKLSGKFATDVAGATNAPRILAYNGANNYPSPSTVPATNLVLNPGFETAGSGGADIWANWTEAAGSGTLANATSGMHNGADCASLTTVSSDLCNILQQITVVANTTYLASYWSKNANASAAGDARHRVLNTSDGDSSIVASVNSGSETADWVQTYFQFTTPTGCTTIKYGVISPSGNYEVLVDDFMLTAFIEKEIEFVATHATTNNFYHFNCEYSATNEMIEQGSNANNSTFASSIGDWVVTDDSGDDATIEHSPDDGGSITINPTTDDEVEGMLLPANYLTDLEVGRSYTVLVNMKSDSGAPGVEVRLGNDAATAQNISTTATTYAFVVSPIVDTGALRIQTDSTDDINIIVYSCEVYPHCNLYVDDISFKEVGVASGWTDADQQLDIAQPALQSYNEMLHSFDSSNAGFDAVTLVKVDDNAALDIGTVDFSVSLWFKTDATYGNYTALIRKGGWSADGYSLGFTSGNKLAINIANYVSVDHVDNYNDWGYTDTAIELGKWYHVVGVWDRSAGMTLYLNGVAQTMVGNYTRDTSGDNLDSASDFNIYSSTTGSTGHFAGCINEVALFKNRAIGAANVLQLYNDGKALDATLCNDASYLKGYWRNNGLSTWENQILVPALSLTNNSTAILLNEALNDNEDGVDVDANHGFIVDDVIVVDSEEMLIISVSTNTLTVARGHNGTTAAAHDNDSAISVYKNGTVIGSETLLIPQGVDGSRDAQGFIMNKARNTSCLNFPVDKSSLTPNLDTGSYVEVDDHSGLTFGTGNFSMECWVKPSYRSKGSSSLNTIFTLGGQINDSDSAGLCTSSTSILAYIGGVNMSKEYSSNNWHHVVATREGLGSGEMKLYINGVEEATGTSVDAVDTSTNINNAHNMTIGAEDNRTRGYEEAVDSIKVYNRALDSTEVTKNYKATKGSHRN